MRSDTPQTPNDPTESIRLLVRLLRRDAAGIRRCLQARPDALDELAAVAVDGGLSVVLLRALADCALAQEISVERQRALACRRERQAMRCAVLEKGLGRVADMFDAAGLPFMLLKGPYLAERFYGDRQGREFVDLDILVRSADRHRAFRMLEEAGYARRSRVLGNEALTAFFVNGFDFVADGVNLDLHWSLSRHPSLRVDESLIWERKGTLLLGGRSYEVLSDEHEVTLAVLALLRDIERGRPKIKNFVDLIQVVAALDATMPWDALFADSRSNGTHGPLVNVLSFSIDVADAHDIASRLTASLAQHAYRRVRSVRVALSLRSGSTRTDLSNRLWAARSYDATLGSWFVWWAVSLPFRRAVHGWPRPVASRATATP
jgi:hypothetical protein